ncbi:MAG: NADH-quinone oxidoreductase subunit L [Cyclobacteriaceae bacterium]|nr:NADH-quinone oxidoreductase subunit L [Cyclobacteriaceae bacterium]
MDFSYIIWVPAVLLASFLVVGLFGKQLKPMLSGAIATLAILLGMVLSYTAAFQYFLGKGLVNGTYQTFIPHNWEWLQFYDTLVIKLGVMIDPISIMMLVVVTTISSMVHIYSFGYMKGEQGFARFYAYLSLFSFSMIGLVIATNIFQMYIFWELVGVSSFLLIGFYYTKPSAVAASKKAFIVTRFADFGFLVGILVLSYYTKTFDFQELMSPDNAAITNMTGISFMGMSVLSWALLLIFMGGAGKSAMFPLHIWLPDAMEGPTPVSALIHAATMVVAGVYLVARLFGLYVLHAPDALAIVAGVGAFTSLFAALIAVTQTDIKRVLAFSTMSQIGYMMLALGVSGYVGTEGLGFTASMFHLFTHAMFKALLFLGAGAVIHAVHSNEMGDMGGLRKYLPITHITFLIAALAISGIPPFAGFFSKDEILAAAYESNQLYFWTEWFVAGLTAFYMFRLYFNIFWGTNRKYEHTPHEAPFSMSFALIFLAVMTSIVGFIPFSQYVSPNLIPFETHFHWNIAIPSVAIGVVGIVVAAILYLKPKATADKIANAMPGLYKLSLRKFYIDEVYVWITHSIIFNSIARPIAWFDKKVVDGSMDGMAWITNKVSDKTKGLQSGQLQQYAFVMIAGVVGLALFVLYWSNK